VAHAIPVLARLDLAAEAGGRRLRIAELRATTGHFRAYDWDEQEAGVSVTAISLVCEPHRLDLIAPTLAYVSLHALTRQLERGCKSSDAAMRADLRELAVHTAGRLPEGDAEVRAGGGRWVGCAGDVFEAHVGSRVLLVRSYLA
jgi:hypothetical protein